MSVNNRLLPKGYFSYKKFNKTEVFVTLYSINIFQKIASLIQGRKLEAFIFNN